MQLEFLKGIAPRKCKKQMHNTSALKTTFRRWNLSLAGCSPAEPASVLVHAQNSTQFTIFTNCLKSQPLSGTIGNKNNCSNYTFHQKLFFF